MAKTFWGFFAFPKTNCPFYLRAHSYCSAASFGCCKHAIRCICKPYHQVSTCRDTAPLMCALPLLKHMCKLSRFEFLFAVLPFHIQLLPTALLYHIMDPSCHHGQNLHFLPPTAISVNVLQPDGGGGGITAVLWPPDKKHLATSFHSGR